MNDSKTYLFFGNVGAGKGTQVEFLKEYLSKKDGRNVVYVSPGVEYRKFVKEEGYSNALAREILDRGNLLPFFLTTTMFSRVILNDLKGKEDHIIFDGFPRTVDQVTAFESAVNFYGRKNSEIVYLEISKDEAIKRMKLRGRHDDTDEGIARRFGEYENNVLPALNLLKDKGYKVYSINAEQSVEKVKEDIFSALGL